MELASIFLKQQGIVYISREVNFGAAPSTCRERQGGKKISKAMSVIPWC